MITSRHRARPHGAVQADGEGADQVASGVSTVTTCRKDCTTSTGARSRAANGVLRRSAELTAKTKGQDREKRRPTAGRADGRSRLPRPQDVPSIRQRPGEPVQLGHYHRVASPTGSQRQPQTGSIPVGAGQTVIDIAAIITDTERLQAIALGGEILLLC